MAKVTFICIGLILICPFIHSQDFGSQLGFKLLDGYIREHESKTNVKVGGAITVAAGGTLLAGAGILWFFGDDITRALSPTNEPWSSTTKSISVASIAASGAVGTGIGIGILLAPEPDYRSQYAMIYTEKDPAVREALAVATLSELAIEAKNDRIVSAWSSLAVPLLTATITVVANISSGKPWDDGVFTVSIAQIGSFVSGFTSLFSLSEEELLYQKYLIAKKAFELAK